MHGGLDGLHQLRLGTTSQPAAGQRDDGTCNAGDVHVGDDSVGLLHPAPTTGKMYLYARFAGGTGTNNYSFKLTVVSFPPTSGIDCSAQPSCGR